MGGSSISYRTLLIDHFLQNNFLCSIADAIHSSYPRHLIVLLHIFRYALGGFHLLDDKFKTVLRLFVKISQISP